MVDRVSDIDCHDAYFLLKDCLAIPKLLFFPRSAPLHESHKLLDLDTILKNGLTKVLNIDLDERKWRQLTLPVKMGGFGIRSVTDIALPAFISSYHKSKETMDIITPSSIKDEPYLDAHIAEQRWLDTPGITNDDLPKFKSYQSNWDSPLCKLELTSLINEATNDLDRARLIGISQPHASDWLEALPSANVGLKMENKQFRVVSALRLGANVCQPHTCACGKVVERNGLHGLSCKRSAGRLPRHSQVNDLIKRALSSGGTAATREPYGISRHDGKRPDGMTMYPWKSGKCLLWDFTCGDTLAPSHL